MPVHRLLDRSRLLFKPLRLRENRAEIREKSESVEQSADRAGVPSEAMRRVAQAVREARRNDKPVILAFGAHTIKNGLGPLIAELAEKGWVTHLATNGAGIIHDWEFAYQGESSENVQENAARGEFGMWKETGEYINLAIVSGAYRGLGYGESVGTLIDEDGIDIPPAGELLGIAQESMDRETFRAAAALDFLQAIRGGSLPPGRLPVDHPFKEYSLQYRALKACVPFTAHPMFGHDIIYTHPFNTGSAVGRSAERDFLSFAAAVGDIHEGVYLSVGSAVMSPMIFEKSFSMAQNLALQDGHSITGHKIFVVDLSECPWDWRQGEPPEDNPAYYLRYLKSFSRMGGVMEYIQADNRLFFVQLRALLRNDDYHTKEH